MGWGRDVTACGIALLATACTTVAVDDDSDGNLCVLLQRVAVDARTDQPRHVRLTTDGVGSVVDYTKTCTWSEQGVASERALCKWWVQHSANEFFNLNASVVAACLGIGDWFGYHIADNQRLFGVTLFVESPPGFDPGHGIWFEYSMTGSAAGVDDAGAFIDIRIERED